MCKGEPSAGRWPRVISGEGSNWGALSRGHPDAKASRLVLSPYLGNLQAKQVHPDSQSSTSQDGQQAGECSSLPMCHCTQRPSSGCLDVSLLRCQLLNCPYGSPLVMCCVICLLYSSTLQWVAEMAVLGASGPAGLILGGRGLTVVNSDKLQS